MAAQEYSLTGHTYTRRPKLDNDAAIASLSIGRQRNSVLSHNRSIAKWQESAILPNAASSRYDSMTAPTLLTEKIQHRIPHVVLVMLIGVRRGEQRRASRGRGVRRLLCQTELSAAEERLHRLSQTTNQ